MFDPQMELVSTALAAAADAPGPDTWAGAREALTAAGEQDPELVNPVRGEDHEALAAVVEAWRAGRRHLPEHDRNVLKRAMKAYRKTLKVTRLDAESSIGGGPMSSGRHSDIVGITPPSRYPTAVWDELVRQGRLLAGRGGTYELPPE